MDLTETFDDRVERRRVYRVDRRALARTLVTGLRWTVIEGVPSDAKLLGVAWDETWGAVLVTLQHDSWEPVGYGAMGPVHVARVHCEIPVPLPERAISLGDLLESPGEEPADA